MSVYVQGAEVEGMTRLLNVVPKIQWASNISLSHGSCIQRQPFSYRVESLDNISYIEFWFINFLLLGNYMVVSHVRSNFCIGVILS